MRPVCCALILLLPGLVLAQDSYEEGRPARVRMSLAPDAKRPVALLRLEGLVGSNPKSSWEGGAEPRKSPSAGARRIRGVSLRPHFPGEIVTVDLVASEDLSHSAAARAPLPEVHANLEGEAFTLCRLLAPGEALSVTVSFVPTVAPQQSLLAWRGVALDPLSAQGHAFARGPGSSWTPGAPRAEGSEDGLDLGGPPTAHGPEFGVSRTALRLHLTRWTPWAGKEATREILLTEGALAPQGALASALTSGEQRSVLEVKPAAFGLAAARTLAKISGDAQGVRLRDDRWVLGQGERWWIVEAQGGVTLGKGEIFPFALDLAREGRAGFLWFAYGDHPKLVLELQKRGFSPKGGGKALAVEITEAGLVTFLGLLDTHGLRLTQSGIERKE